MIKLFALPIGLLLLSLIAASVIILKIRNPKLNVWALAFVGSLFLFFFTPLGANFLVGILESPARLATYDENCSRDGQPDTIVVLAGGIIRYPSHTIDITSLSKASIDRVSKGVNFAKTRKRPLIIFSGGNGWPDKEADIMLTLAEHLGFSSKQMFSEVKSRTTHENATNVYEILTQRKIYAVWLVTSAMHMPRAAASFAKSGIKVCPYPVDPEYNRTRLPGAVMPQLSAVTKSTRAMHELIGLSWYWLTDRT